MTVSIDPQYTLALTTAVSKAINKKTAREALAPGVYKNLKLTLDVRVKTMRVAPDTDRAATISIPWATVCAFMLDRLSGDPGQAATLLRDALTHAYSNSLIADQLEARYGLESILVAWKRAKAAELPREPVKGAVTIQPEDIEIIIHSAKQQ